VEDQDPRQLLARRLRALREERWPGRRITQQELARALGGVSVPLISSWESQTSPRTPPLPRLDAYARLFATPRSFDQNAPEPLSSADLTGEEVQAMNELRRELRQLRSGALRAGVAEPEPARPIAESLGAGPWRFTAGETITIVCAQLPQDMRDLIPYTNVDDPDYIELLTYSELDSLFELHGHIRAANPTKHVYRRVASKLEPDDLHSHLAVLGGVDWNMITSTTLEKLQLPVRQVADWGTEGAQYFEVKDEGLAAQHRPVLQTVDGQQVLQEDVALFARAVSPFNQERTVTICSGMYGRGTYGVVRALTDLNFRDRNAEYLQARFGENDTYCLLSRVQIIHGVTLTPDWTIGDTILFEWSR
jgi:transcriptional regulator with XRE-family HTH domain